jgi:hypothetical protein
LVFFRFCVCLCLSFCLSCFQFKGFSAKNYTSIYRQEARLIN